MELRVKETADWLKVSPATVRRYLARGILRGRRLPTGERRIDSESVQEILAKEAADDPTQEGTSDV